MPVFTASTQVVTNTLDSFISHCLGNGDDDLALLVASDVSSNVTELWTKADGTQISNTYHGGHELTPPSDAKLYSNMNIMEWLIECVQEGYKVKKYCAEREMFAEIIVNLCAPVASDLEAAHAPQGDLLATHLVKDAFKCGKDGEFTMWFKLPQLTDLQYQTQTDFIAGKKPNQLQPPADVADVEASATEYFAP